ncbi:CVNH domain-containing protein [Colletotrichum karsti]|uniref:CVNH domain-containing protein n=1 Tax=Colletotrichum karsti TaxID=1095194 RepID=A0A9P6LJ03_9PEZI|nr:CVNH domain-containing protein [Colletotrichum karsti]KAF9875188.1 CVNH domain-containing protein [Colletotrichum karsti]
MMVKLLPMIVLKGITLTFGLAKVARAGFLDEGCGYLTDGPQFALRGDGSVTTYCEDNICGSSTFSVINLNDCLSNVLGDLQETCQDCAPDGFADIKCKCKTLAGDYKETSIDLNEVLTNWNGYLSCRGGISDCYNTKWVCKPKDWWPEGPPPEIFSTDCDIWS